MSNTEPRLVYRDPEAPHIRRGRCNMPLGDDDCRCYRPGNHDGHHECHCETYPGSTHGMRVELSRTMFEAVR